ncbi:spore germination protein, partial [Neobacillus vireti]|uniref:spore germination protein n=1 Tax=Neobacillus vireti TaxID=220686 RepID=UPI002FFF879A
IRTSLKDIKTDGLITINDLEELIMKRKSILIPHFGYTGRPDYAADILLSGRFIIIIDGSPTVLIAPVTLTFLIRTSEDNFSLKLQSFFSIVFRYFGLLISLLLPGLWTALLSFNPDQLPYTMLATILLSRLGVPFQLPIEIFIMIFLFDIFKEASLRMPGPLGQTLSVVGGLIIGQAAISAGLTAPGVLVVIAVSVVASFTIINQELSIAIRVLRLFNVLFSSLFGLIGFFLSSFAILTYLVNIKSFGVPFLSPFSPYNSKEFFSALGHIPKYLKGKKTNIDAEKR